MQWPLWSRVSVCLWILCNRGMSRPLHLASNKLSTRLYPQTCVPYTGRIRNEDYEDPIAHFQSSFQAVGCCLTASHPHQQIPYSPSSAPVLFACHSACRPHGATVRCRCVITKSSYTQDETFDVADAIYDCIGDAGQERFSLPDLARLLT